MTTPDDPFAAQLHRQDEARARAAQAWQAADDELRPWPALRDDVQERVLPALHDWRRRLHPRRSRWPQRRFVLRADTLGWTARALPWLSLSALRLRLESAALWLAVNWRLVIWALVGVAALALGYWGAINWDQVRQVFEDLIDDLR